MGPTSKKRKQVSMKDVAEAAEVSVSTVSRVINKSASISPAVTARVMDVMAEIGYVPRAAADISRGQRSIAVFVPDIANEFYAKSVQAIIDEAWKNNYAVVLCATKHHQMTLSRYANGMIQGGIKGVIFFGGSSSEESLIVNTAKKVPVVLGDRMLARGDVDSVITDNRDIMRRSVNKLYRAGYTRIGYITEDIHMSNIRDRYQGFIDGLKEHNLPIDKDWVICSENLRLNKTENSYELIYNTLKRTERYPQVIMCSSDLIAMGAMSALRLMKIKVPGEVGVVGFDDISIARYMDPPLTTIAQNMEKLGKQCVATLIERIESPGRPHHQVIVPAKFITRQTVRL